MKKIILLSAIFALVISCGKGDNTFTLSGNNVHDKITADKDSVTISGSSHVITIAEGVSIGILSVSGTSIYVRFEKDSTVEKINLSGINNEIRLANKSSYDQIKASINTSGTGNSITWK